MSLAHRQPARLQPERCPARTSRGRPCGRQAFVAQQRSRVNPQELPAARIAAQSRIM